MTSFLASVFHHSLMLGVQRWRHTSNEGHRAVKSCVKRERYEIRVEGTEVLNYLLVRSTCVALVLIGPLFGKTYSISAWRLLVTANQSLATCPLQPMFYLNPLLSPQITNLARLDTNTLSRTA